MNADRGSLWASGARRDQGRGPALQQGPAQSGRARSDGGGAVTSQQTWARTAMGVTLFAVAAITTITAAVSYEHEYELARRTGQAPWVSSMLPFTVDGMILGASVVLVWAASVGIRRPGRPLVVLLVGIGATIGANLAFGLGDGWLGAAVSAWSGVALILISDVAMWLTGALRRLSAADDPRPELGCTCPPQPPPPLTPAEVLAAARAELRERGEAAGELALAERFGWTRHQVRSALAGGASLDAVVAVAPADGTPAIRAATAASNGHGPLP